MRHRKENQDITELNIPADKEALFHTFEDFLISEGLECEEISGIVAGAEAIIEEEANRRACEVLSRLLEQLPQNSAAALELRRCIFDRGETLEAIGEQAQVSLKAIHKHRQMIIAALDRIDS